MTMLIIGSNLLLMNRLEIKCTRKKWELGHKKENEIGNFLNRDHKVVSYYMKQAGKKECQELIARVKYL